MIMKGDISLDYKIGIEDIALLRMHLLGLITLTGDALRAADISGDGSIDGRDLARLAMHVYGGNIITEVIQ